MSFHKFHNNIPVKWLIVLTVVVLSLILVIGLKPKDLSSSNNVDWLTDRPGLRFEKNSIAYTDSIADLIHEHISPQRGFSVEIALKPQSFHEERFCFIFSIHGGSSRSQFLIGQWHAALIVMNGDDYNHSRKTKRISYRSPSAAPHVQLLTLTTAPEGSKIYIDGRLVSSRKDLHLALPDVKSARLLLGNSVYGRHAWEGEIYGAALYGKALSQKDIETHFRDWSENRSIPFSKEPSPLLLYLFREKGGALAEDHTGGAHPLHLPARMKPLSPRLFSWSQLGRISGRSIFTSRDALLNFFGFIPLGFLLSATLIKLGGRSGRHAVVITLAAGFLVSLLIETVQAWIPDRNSDILDLTLNTAGTLIGAALCRYLSRARTEY